MKCHLEITSAVLRVYEDGVEYGGPFKMAISLVGDEGIAILKGLRTDNLTMADKVAIFDCLIEHGFSEVQWRRRTENSSRLVRRKLIKTSSI
jgi:hypothetical protein